MLRLYSDCVDDEVPQQQLRHNGTGGYTGPVSPEEVSDGVDLSVVTPGDVEPVEARHGVQVFCEGL